MIQPKKIRSAFTALQEIFIFSRWQIGKNGEIQNIYDLLDGAEYLAGLACRDDDQTDTFERYLAAFSEKHSCPQILRAFSEATCKE